MMLFEPWLVMIPGVALFVLVLAINLMGDGLRDITARRADGTEGKPMTAPILKVQGLTLDIPTAAGTLHAVRNINLEVKPGETLCIVGESGSGKSADLACGDGALSPGIQRNAAEMSFDGIDPQRPQHGNTCAAR